jgi:hypothetical protein
MFLSNFKVSLKENKECSLGSPEGKVKNDDKQNNEASIYNHGKTNKESQDYSQN